jgi:hypothetical protein
MQINGLGGQRSLRLLPFLFSQRLEFGFSQPCSVYEPSPARSLPVAMAECCRLTRCCAWCPRRARCPGAPASISSTRMTNPIRGKQGFYDSFADH